MNKTLCWVFCWALAAPAALGARQITNPVLDRDFPDPTVIRAGDRYYAYATNSRVGGKVLHIQVASSPDLQHWTSEGDAMPSAPAWASGDFWAPHVLYDSSLRQYVLFFSAESRDTGLGKCLGVAFADNPLGPFRDKGSPLRCGAGFRNIDPFAFTDPRSGRRLLYWGSDFQPIRVQEMGPDWKSFLPGSHPEALVRPGSGQGFDRLIEGAWVDYHQGWYYLYYSGDNCCGAQAHYAVMVARSRRATGPFETMVHATGRAVVLGDGHGWRDPGHNSVVRDADGQAYIAYHAYHADTAQRRGRVFCISPLRYVDGWPRVEQDSSPAFVQWGEEVLVNEVPPRAATGPGAYGSEYGRLLSLGGDRWLAAYTVSRNEGYLVDNRGGYTIEVAESRDRGRHWQAVGSIADPGRDLDNAALTRLPGGALLLACRSVRWQESYRLPVYRSEDEGRHWTRIGLIDANEGSPGQLGRPDKGLYEPHVQWLENGQLAVLYASEKHVTDSIPYSQIIAERVSPDSGRHWGPEIWVAYDPAEPGARPGMPVWTRLPQGGYFAVYEVCGSRKCAVYHKRSEDGIHWPAGLGELLPAHTGGPYVLALDDGRLVVSSNTGHVSVSSDGGRHWRLAASPWHHKVSFEKDWTQTIWSALYQTGPREIAIITSVKRPAGGHAIRLRFGQISPAP